MRIITLLPFIPITLGCAALWWGGRDLVLGIASAAWPVTDGRIVADPEAAVAYEFRADGVPHRGDRVRFGATPWRDAADTTLDAREYPVGRRVDVRHDPSDPSRSVLTPGLSFAAFVVPGIGGVLVTVGSAALLAVRMHGRIERRRRRAAARAMPGP